MKIKYIYSLFCIFVIIGFFVGFFSIIPTIISNQYINYKMFRIASLLLQQSLNKWMLILFSCFVSFMIIFFILQLLLNFFSLNNYLQIEKKFRANPPVPYIVVNVPFNPTKTISDSQNSFQTSFSIDPLYLI